MLMEQTVQGGDGLRRQARTAPLAHCLQIMSIALLSANIGQKRELKDARKSLIESAKDLQETNNILHFAYRYYYSYNNFLFG
ncbi:uncharacterized protein [Triticum aestivum]|uniref:uncharacterized protein isoform X2 n=1 Tax=Triticum aestivum TaxID=4565 RepID=UPI001D006CF3|nr:uncharacterized protein LOC123064333 isoform X2 [Triticum aestivum]